MGVRYTIRLVHPNLLAKGPINTYVVPGQVIRHIDMSARIDPALVEAMACATGAALARVSELPEPGPPVMTVRYHLERDIPDREMVLVIPSPLQWDVHVDRSLIAEPLARTMEADSTQVLRRFTFGGTNGWSHCKTLWVPRRDNR